MPIQDLIQRNVHAPHRSVIFIEAETHELLKTGECSGMPVHKIEKFPLYVDGMDFQLAIKRLNEVLADLKERCKP